MSHDIFRKENLDAAKSPDSTDGLVRVARIPRVLIVIAVVAFIAAWACKLMLLS